MAELINLIEKNLTWRKAYEEFFELKFSSELVYNSFDEMHVYCATVTKSRLADGTIQTRMDFADGSSSTTVD